MRDLAEDANCCSRGYRPGSRIALSVPASPRGGLGSRAGASVREFAVPRRRQLSRHPLSPTAGRVFAGDTLPCCLHPLGWRFLLKRLLWSLSSAAVNIAIAEGQIGLHPRSTGKPRGGHRFRGSDSALLGCNERQVRLPPAGTYDEHVKSS